jgi:nucleotidyltransferase substrate binding protein (TIGR01987 family)
MDEDMRWMQRFDNFRRAFAQIKSAVDLSNERTLSELEKQGLIQAFEYTHELAWNTLKDFLEEKGVSKIYGSKDATREAFKQNLVSNGQIWMDMIKSRNLTSHTYNTDIAEKIENDILNRYYAEFLTFENTFALLAEEL